MSEVVENWSDVTGYVVSVQTHPALVGYSQIELDVTRVDPVEAWPNLFQDTVGSTIHVSLPNDVIASSEITAGSMIECRVRRGGPEAVFVDPQEVHVFHVE